MGISPQFIEGLFLFTLIELFQWSPEMEGYFFPCKMILMENRFC
jgi:hypothetical protein